MNGGKVRIYELSLELKLENKELLTICESLGIVVKSHSSTVTDREADQIRQVAVQLNQKSQNSSRSKRRRDSSVTPEAIQQILETRSAVAHASSSDATFRQRLPIRRTSRTGQGYIEPLLDVGTALPLHMVLIPGGTFKMGSPEDKPERFHDRESPQHEVTVPQFFMGRYPVTQAQWRAVAHLPQVKRELNPEPSRFKGKDNHPVEQVTWYDAVEFCARLEKHTNRPYRLPSEAEWEYACRAGTTTPFHFGKTLTDELANYVASETYADGPKGEYRGETTAVDYFGIANAFGLSDMHGNVFEWCQDHWHNNYDDAPTDGSAWLTDDESSSRIVRGGSWNFNPGVCRSAFRDNYFPDVRNYDFGFRVCCSSPRTLP